MATTMKKRSGTVCRKKFHSGKRGGVYYIRKGKKVYLPLASCPKSAVGRALAQNKKRPSSSSKKAGKRSKKRTTRKLKSSSAKSTSSGTSRFVRLAKPVIVIDSKGKHKVRLYRKKGTTSLYRRRKSKTTGKYRYVKVTGKQLKTWKSKASRKTSKRKSTKSKRKSTKSKRKSTKSKRK